MRSRIPFLAAALLLQAGFARASQTLNVRTATVAIESIHARQQGAETRIAIVVRGKVEPKLTVADRVVTLRLAAARPGPHLDTQMVSGGLVKRVGFQSGLRAGGSVTEEGQIILDLNASADASILPSTDSQTITVRLVPRTTASISPISHSEESRLFDITAYQTDVSLLLRSLAQEANCNILLSDKVTSKVTINLHQVELAKAVDLITRSAGLAVKRDGDTYLVGPQDEVKAAPQLSLQGQPPADPGPKHVDTTPGIYEVIHCHYVLASDLAATLTKMFAPEDLKVSLGAATFAPKLEAGGSTASVTGIDTGAAKGSDKADAGANSHDVVLYGSAEIVTRAVALAKRLDARRAQLRIGVAIEITRAELSMLGLHHG